MKINICINRIFGIILGEKLEVFIKKIANSYRSCYFEKKKGENKSWYLTIKNIGEKFNITEYINKLKNESTYKESILTFPETEESCTEHQIKSEFFSEKVQSLYEIFKNERLNLPRFSKNNSLNFIFEELFKYVDKTFVDAFFRDKVKYKILSSNVIFITNFCEELNIEHFLFLVNNWKKKVEDNYSTFFMQDYEIFNVKRKIFIVFKIKPNPIKT